MLHQEAADPFHLRQVLIGFSGRQDTDRNLPADVRQRSAHLFPVKGTDIAVRNDTDLPSCISQGRQFLSQIFKRRPVNDIIAGDAVLAHGQSPAFCIRCFHIDQNSFLTASAAKPVLPRPSRRDRQNQKSLSAGHAQRRGWSNCFLCSALCSRAERTGLGCERGCQIHRSFLHGGSCADIT